jgi:hypothetical protein
VLTTAGLGGGLGLRLAEFPDVVPGVVPAAGGVASPCDHAELAKLTKHSKIPRVLEIHRLEGLGAFSCMPLP